MKMAAAKTRKKENTAMSAPLVSVIVPAYNAQGTLRRCVESITSQSYPELEILLLNDGSKDGTLALCRQLAAADARIRVVDKPNTGAADTRNQGLALAKGEYIQFADSDDYLLPGCTANLVAAAQRSRADLVLAPYRMMVPRKGGGYDSREYSLLPAGVYSKADYLWWVIGQPASFYFTVLWNKLFRRDVIAANGVQFPLTAFTEDQQFCAAYLHHAEGAFVALDEAGYCYVQNPQSVCHTQVTLRAMLEHRQRMYRMYSQMCREMGLYAQYRTRLRGIYLSLFESTAPSGPVQKLSDTIARTHSRI